MSLKHLLSLATLAATAVAAQDARQILSEVQKRSQADSQHYEGVNRVIDAGGKTSEKQWIYNRIGSHGKSKVVIRFTAPADVKGVALLIVNHLERSADHTTSNRRWAP
jgi:hypothetical protein